MILSVKITIEELSKNGRAHNWGKHRCEKCQRDMWGHGFVARYFAETAEQIYLKRYRCPECSTVVTTRPETHGRSIQTALLTIYSVLSSKLSGLWPAGFPRQRGLHWLRQLVELAKMGNEKNLPAFLAHCFSKRIYFFT